MMAKPLTETDQGHSRHVSEGGSFSYGGGNSSAPSSSIAKNATTLPMTRFDHLPPPIHPCRFAPQQQPSPSGSPAKAAGPHQRSLSFQCSKFCERSAFSEDQSSSRSGNVASSLRSTANAPSQKSAINAQNNIHLTRISVPEHIAFLPPEFLTNDVLRPLLHVDEAGREYRYFLNPMRQAVLFILLVEILERFSFYGINYTTTAYLTGEYNDDWNADMPSILASSYVSISTAVAYTTPFLGALLADKVLGEYTTIFLGTVLCYIPGLLLIALTTIPQYLGRNFNRSAIKWGLLVLWPVGTGTVKACVNVFGAKQFHPILQSSLIELYYVNFYMCINIGALTGGIIVPIVAQCDVTMAYFIPVCMLGMGAILFVARTGRYVKPKPKHDAICCGNRRSKRKQMVIQPSPSESEVGITTIALLSSLVVPFNVAYAQMATTFIVQGTVMENFGLVDAPMMNNADAMSVLTFGYIISNIIYPALNRRQIKIPTTYKFAIGSAFGAVAVGCAIVTDYQIHRVYEERGVAVSVLWQVFPYSIIGIGEIFAVSTAYELAFTVAPARMKSVASAANLFMLGGLPNALCIMLYNACKCWFLNDRGEAHINKLDDYASAKVVKYFWLLEAISLLGVIVNILPPIKSWVANIEDRAVEAVRSPMNTPNIRKNLMRRRKHHKQQGSGGAEETPLIQAQKHVSYLEYGAGPELRKFGSMRAGLMLKKDGLPRSHHCLFQDPAHSPITG